MLTVPSLLRVIVSQTETSVHTPSVARQVQLETHDRMYVPWMLAQVGQLLLVTPEMTTCHWSGAPSGSAEQAHGLGMTATPSGTGPASDGRPPLALAATPTRRRAREDYLTLPGSALRCQQ